MGNSTINDNVHSYVSLPKGTSQLTTYLTYPWQTQ